MDQGATSFKTLPTGISTTSVGTPGVDTQVPTEKAVRTAITNAVPAQSLTTDELLALLIAVPELLN